MFNSHILPDFLNKTNDFFSIEHLPQKRTHADSSVGRSLTLRLSDYLRAAQSSYYF